MLYLATFDKEYTIDQHAKDMMGLFLVTADKVSSLDLSDEFKFDDYNDFCEMASEFDYNRFRRLMQKYGVTAKHLETREGLTKYHGTGGPIASYTNEAQFKKIALESCKNWLKADTKGSKEYVEHQKLYGKIKMLNNAEQIDRAAKQCATILDQDAVWDHKFFNDFEDYLQYIFDNQ